MAALSAVVVAVGFVAIMANLDLLPAGAALTWLALVPFIREQSPSAPVDPGAPMSA